MCEFLTHLKKCLKEDDMNLPGLRLHKLIGDKEGFWTVDVSGNWRVFFRFEGNNAFDVHYGDYH
ncbi:MAG: hypothetical protein C4519_23935 [Desulfobacteraceae bacterium]|jgi:proteic killer suppression protein|nr:MAG: hypothetical protein C4519_23935 [Desulfobacteraceae bacterium]